MVADSGSLNGTYVNQERVERAALRHGDEVQIGKFRLVFFERTDGEPMIHGLEESASRWDRELGGGRV